MNFSGMVLILWYLPLGSSHSHSHSHSSHFQNITSDQIENINYNNILFLLFVILIFMSSLCSCNSRAANVNLL